VLAGTGYNPTKEFTKGRIANYTANGVDYRWEYTFEDLSAGFRTTPLAHFFANLFTERNQHADVQTIIHQFQALAQPYTEGHHERIACPTIILTGSEDNSHQRAFALQARIPNCELRTLPGAGHACQIEQPWLFDRFMIEFLAKHGLFPGESTPGKTII
jgi:pimeloyl-ACP methyl ester carboxylesterase